MSTTAAVGSATVSVATLLGGLFLNILRWAARPGMRRILQFVLAAIAAGLGRAALPYAERGGGWLWHKVLWCCGAVWLAVKWAAATYASFWMLTSLLLFFPALADTLADAMIDGFMAVLARYPAFYDWAQMDVPQAAVRFYTACTNVTIVWQ